MPEQAVQALIATFRGEFGDRLDAIERTEAQRHEQLVRRLDAISLNGDAPALRQLAKATPDLLVIARHAGALERIAGDNEDSRAGWRWLRARVHWDQGVGTFVKLTVAGFIAAFTLIIALKLLAAPPSSAVPNLPRVTVPAVTVSPIPVVTP